MLARLVSAEMSERWECGVTRAPEVLQVKMEFAEKMVNRVRWGHLENLAHAAPTHCKVCPNSYCWDQKERKVNLATQVQEVDLEFQVRLVTRVRWETLVHPEKMVQLALKDQEDVMVWMDDPDVQEKPESPVHVGRLAYKDLKGNLEIGVTRVHRVPLAFQVLRVNLDFLVWMVSMEPLVRLELLVL